MKKTYINRIDVTKMRKALHYEFYKTMEGIFGKIDINMTFMKDILIRFIEVLVIEDLALNPIRKSDATERIHENDRLRGNAFYAMRETVQTALRHFDPAKSAAARRLYIIFESYKHTPKLELPAESAAIHNLLQELDRHKESVELLGLKEWAEELKKYNDTVRELMSQRNTEAAEQLHVSAKEARMASDVVYGEIVAKLEATATLAGEDGLQQLFNEMNACVDEYQRILARGKGNSEETYMETSEAS